MSAAASLSAISARLDDVLITSELARRPAQQPDFKAENRALVALAREMAVSPHNLPQKLVNLALELSQADSAGLSLLEKTPEGEEVFCWMAVAGTYKAYQGGTEPADSSPCRTTLERGEAQLFSYPGRHFTSLSGAEPPIVEGLVAPVYSNGKPLAAIWIFAHNEQRQFDSEDVRLLQSLGEFAGAALRIPALLNAERQACEQQVRADETQARNETLEQEIRRRREVEAALREGKRRFGEMIDALPAAIYATDAEGRLTHFNPAAVEFSGRMPELGTDHWCVSWKLYHPDGTPLPHDECPMAIALRDGRALRGAEAIAERPDGTRIWFAAYPSPLRDDEGKIVGGINMLIDVTERKRVEQALRESEERLRSTLDIETVGVIFFDTEGQITDANDAFLRMSGFSREDLSGGRLRWDEMTPPEWMPHSLRAIEELKATGRTKPYEKKYIRKNGSRWWALFAAKSLNDSEGVEFILDITERKRAEEALHDADRRKDEFLAILAHELRNPLAPLRNALEILRLKEGDHKGISRVRKTMVHQVDHLTRLVDDLLEVSRITRGKIGLRKERIEIKRVVQNAVEISRPLINAADHELSIKIPRRPLYVDADPVRLTQVIANLLNNAVKYTEGPGQIELSAARKGAAAVVRVRDTGIGISRELLPKVFDLFAQVDTSSTRAQGGLGIGLTLVKHLVDLHSGSIEAKSRGLGHGSEFIVRLPIAADELPHAEAAQRADIVSSDSKARRILVADDNAAAADTLAELLGLLGSEVQVVYNGQAALDAFDAYRPDVMLLDIGMPGMDGYEVARRVRRQPGSQGIMLIALTGWGQEEDRELAREAGFDHHLIKPLDLRALQELLRSLSDPGAS